MVGSFLRNIHFYRKTPSDLTHSTSSGGALSVVALIIMAYLFVSQVFTALAFASVTRLTQLQMYFTVDVKTTVMMDSIDDGKVRHRRRMRYAATSRSVTMPGHDSHRL